jgi:hypothetical protein
MRTDIVLESVVRGRVTGLVLQPHEQWRAAAAVVLVFTGVGFTRGAERHR